VLAWLARSVCALVLALTLSCRGAVAAPTAPLLMQPPAVTIQTDRAVPSDDMSAAVRVHRDGRSLDVWLITPHSIHWAARARAPPLLEQLEARRWPLPRSGANSFQVRFERLATVIPRAKLLRA